MASLHARIREQLVRELATAAADESAQLSNALRLLAKWRSALLQNTLVQHEGTKVLAGPFEGLDFVARSAEGCHIAKLLGCYEQPLHRHVERAIAAGYDCVLNIGCAEGYYAVGMARSMPSTRVFAFDTNPVAQAACAALAAKNGVGDLVHVAGLFSHVDFAHHAAGRVLVVCDIEGAERDLLDPVAAPTLAAMDMIVESHECLVPGITQALLERFEATHRVLLVHDDGQRELANMPPWFNQLSHLDQLLAVWEWRSGPTPWLVMTSKAG